MNPLLDRTIREQVATHLHHAVLAAQLNAREMLRKQPLAKHFGISRGPIPDALLQLMQEGMESIRAYLRQHQQINEHVSLHLGTNVHVEV